MSGPTSIADPVTVDLPEDNVIKSAEESAIKEAPPQQKGNREPYIDVIRVGLTWGILLFHVVLIYLPLASYYLKDPFYDFGNHTTLSPSAMAGLGFIKYMHAWNMPMFFLLSGISAFYALNRRSLSEFRLERYHRLLIPCLVIMAVTQLPLWVAYAAKLEGWCLAWRNGSLPAKDRGLCKMFYPPGPNVTAISYIVGAWKGFGVPSPSQGWFLANLFFYSQIVGSMFYYWHPSSSADPNRNHRCRGCVCFMGRWSRTPEEFSNAAGFLLGGPVKLAIVPSLVLAIIEVARWWDVEALWFFGAFSDFPNTLHFGFVYVAGFAMAAADNQGIGDSTIRFGWIYFIVGNILLLLHITCGGLSLLFSAEIAGFSWLFSRILSGIFRGFGEWLFMIGLMGVCRRHIQNYPNILKKLVLIAMPFYVIHQQILVVIGVGTLRVPVLHHFPFLLILSTIATFGISWLITEAGFLRYFFGLPAPKGSWIPGKVLKGLIPGIVLAIIIIIQVIIANTVKINSKMGL